MRIRFLLIALTAFGAAACGSGRAGAVPRIRLDHSTAHSAAPALTDAGPAPGTLAESWHVDTPSPAGAVSSTPRLVAGQFVTATAQGVDAHDAGTGRARWHYRERGRRVTAYAVTSGSLVIMTDDENMDRRTSRWTGLDAATGRVEWSIPAPGYRLPGGDSLGAAAGQGMLPLMPVTGGGIRGLDARTGRLRWTRQVAERGCTTPIVGQLGAEDTDGSLFAVKENCGGRTRLLALDPATGAVRWARDVQQQGITRVRQGITLIDDARGLVVLAADGHAVTDARHVRRCEEPCRFAVAGDHAVVTGAREALTVDLLSRQVLSRPLTTAYEALTVAAGQVYGVRGELGESRDPAGVRLLPAALDVIDPAAGTVRTGPAPFALAADSGDAGRRGVSWIAVAGGRLYAGHLAAGAFRTTAYATARPGLPGELGGVRASDWPDACAVAPGYKSAAPASPEAGTVTVGAVTLHKLSCDYRLAGDARLDVVWVAPTPDDAHRLLTVEEPAQPVQVDGADEAYAFVSPAVLWFRAGRYVLRIGQTGLEAQALASAVAKHLRTR